MRRAAPILLTLAAAGLGGCLTLAGVECQDQCELGDDRCDGTLVQTCIPHLIVTGCNVWMTEEDCAERQAVCAGSRCVYPPARFEAAAPAWTWRRIRTTAARAGGCAGGCVRGTCVP